MKLKMSIGSEDSDDLELEDECRQIFMNAAANVRRMNMDGPH